ncbi:MAG: response regulator, partial [Chitinophagaceae bacterium]
LRNTSAIQFDSPRGWNGIGWFGMWVKADTSLIGKKMSFRINHDGASEIFVDGRPVGGYGKLGPSKEQMVAVRAPRDLIPMWFTDTASHLIVIHYSNFFDLYPAFRGFQVWIGDYNVKAEQVRTGNLRLNFVALFAAAQIILGLLHLLLFIFYPKQRLNLLYALFVLIIGINGFSVYLFYQTSVPGTQVLADFLTAECKVLMLLFAVWLLYMFDYGKIPRYRAVLTGVVTLAYLIAYVLQFWVYSDRPWNDYFTWVFLPVILDGFWSAAKIIRFRKKGVRFVAAGVVAVILIYFFVWADQFGFWPYQYNSLRLLTMGAGQLFLPLCLSVYLAINIARTNEALGSKLEEVERLSAHALAQETEKRELLAGEARRLEVVVGQRTAALKEQTEKLKEMDGVKTRFFSNITHELRTPLTLIINPAMELIAGRKEGQEKKQLGLILNNANRLLQLINQLLDLGKAESGLMPLNAAPLDLVALISNLAQAYETIARQKGIEIRFDKPWDELWINADRDKLEKIFLNILSNAIKFTDKGFLDLSLEMEGDDFLMLSVRDTGRGIPAAKLPYIFDRFYQADPSDTRSAEGTGIGLALAKELVHLMGGELHAESREFEFTEMTIRIPYEAAMPGNGPSEKINGLFIPVIRSTAPVRLIPDVLQEDDKPFILLVEDNAELRDFIHESLITRYRVLLAADGQEGIKIALAEIPALVITDLMMPRADGYELTSTLKKDERTSHIPIIMLTAKSGVENRILGIETGADSYLQKPFDKRELFALIVNLLSVRSQLREHYSRGDGWLNNKLPIPSIEKEFLNRIKTAIESHLDDDQYSAEQMARDAGLSRTQLHRKLKALVGLAPGEMIRTVRLQYAHDLLAGHAATVSEVAYKVGFSSPASFSTSFSRHFGYPPKDAITR